MPPAPAAPCPLPEAIHRLREGVETVELFDLNAVASYAVKPGSAPTTARVGFLLEQHREALKRGRRPRFLSSAHRRVHADFIWSVARFLTIRSSSSWARVAWAWCTRRRTPAWIAWSHSSVSAHHSWPTPIAGRASSGRRERLPASITRTSRPSASAAEVIATKPSTRSATIRRIHVYLRPRAGTFEVVGIEREADPPRIEK